MEDKHYEWDGGDAPLPIDHLKAMLEEKNKKIALLNTKLIEAEEVISIYVNAGGWAAARYLDKWGKK